MRSASSARLVDVATSVIGIDVKDGLVDGAFGDVGAGVKGGGSGRSTSGTVGTGGTTRRTSRCSRRKRWLWMPLASFKTL